MSSANRGLRPMLARLGAPGIAAACLIAAAAVAVGATLPGFVTAVFTSSPRPVTLPADSAQGQAARVEGYRTLIDGRTMFFLPAKPPPSPVVVESDGEEDPPPAPPPPSTYGGPAPFAMINDTVWFADGKRLKAGGEAEGDVEVVRLEAPWAAVLKWKGVEFTVKVFDRDTVVIKAPGDAMVVGTPPEPKPPPPPEPKPADPTAPPPPAAPPGDQPGSTSGVQPTPPPEPPAAPEGQPQEDHP